MRPFSIKLFSPSGEPKGVLIASRDDWPGRAVIFPRELVGEVKGRKEYKQPGVYILVSSKLMYIGEGDPVGDRIDTHDKKKEFWSRGIFFTAESGRLNKAHVQHLESRLIDLAKLAKRVDLDNLNQPTIPALSEEDHAFTENFLREVLLMLPILGFWQFSDEEDDAIIQDDLETANAVEETIISSAGKRAKLYSAMPLGLSFNLTYKNLTSNLVITEGGVLVKKDSLVVHPIPERFELDSPAYAALRRQLTESGVVADSPSGWLFTKDQFFSSGSAAASVIRATHSNADWWRGNDGKNLGDYIREAKGKL